MPFAATERFEQTRCGVDLSNPRQKDEKMPVRFPQRLRDHPTNRLRKVTGTDRPLAVGQVVNRHRKEPTLGRNHRCITEPSCHWPCLEGCAHHHDAKLRPERLAQPYQHAEDQVHFGSSLVKLIEHDCRDTLKTDVVE